jgi:hypothetical protein
MIRSIVLVCLVGVVALAGCKKRNSSPPAPKDQAQATASFDSCALITKQEIEAIEESPVIDSKNSGRSDEGLSFTQCFYTTKEFSRSVSLAVTRAEPNASPKRSIKEYWEGMFGKFEGEHKQREEAEDKEKRESLHEQRREKGEEGESAPPKKVTGVGEEAFWIGNRVGGALYVLQKNNFVRVSVGGPDPEEKKIEKCKALAEKAFPRL